MTAIFFASSRVNPLHYMHIEGGGGGFRGGQLFDL